jgi:DNA invertase Pin-like site-specific DNA recombinase
VARKAKLVKAVAYLRTSSATNVGADKDSDKRQRAAIVGFAKRAGFEIVGEFYDPAVKGEDRIETRPGFAALLDRIESNGVRTVIIDEISRLARDVLTQELGILALIQRGVTVMTASGDDLTNTDDPMKVFTRQIAGAFSQLEKARLVAKLRGARERKRKEGHKVEGRKSLAETAPEAVALARQLSEQRPRLSLRQISATLAEAGHVSIKGKGSQRPGGNPYSASAVASMLD